MTNLEEFKAEKLALEVDESFEGYEFIQSLIDKCLPISNEKYIERVKKNSEYNFLVVDNFSVFYPDSEHERKIALTTYNSVQDCKTMKAQDFVEEYRAQQLWDNLQDFINSTLALEVDENTEAIDVLQELIEQNTEVQDKYKAGNKGCAKELANRAITRYGIGNACISFDSGTFGWCNKQWYIDEGYRVIHIRDFIVQHCEPDSNAEDEWEKLYKEYTGESNAETN